MLLFDRAVPSAGDLLPPYGTGAQLVADGFFFCPKAAITKYANNLNM